MANGRMPYQIIDDLAAARSKWSDAEVLAELADIPPLADESDPCWEDDRYLHRIAYPYLALWNVVAGRRLRVAVPLILDRACFGDPGEIMRNLCHAVEAIVKPEWSALTAPCVAARHALAPGSGSVRVGAAPRPGRDPGVGACGTGCRAGGAGGGGVRLGAHATLSAGEPRHAEPSAVPAGE